MRRGNREFVDIESDAAESLRRLHVTIQVVECEEALENKKSLIMHHKQHKQVVPD